MCEIVIFHPLYWDLTHKCCIRVDSSPDLKRRPVKGLFRLFLLAYSDVPVAKLIKSLSLACMERNCTKAECREA